MLARFPLRLKCLQFRKRVSSHVGKIGGNNGGRNERNATEGIGERYTVENPGKRSFPETDGL